VIAIKAELDAWVTASPIREALPVRRAALDNAVVLNEFRERLKELRRLRQESAELRLELHRAVEALRANLGCSRLTSFDPLFLDVNECNPDLSSV
jgi:hypothetical protein